MNPRLNQFACFLLFVSLVVTTVTAPAEIFGPAVTFPGASDINPGPEDLAVADLSRDGYADLAVSCNGFVLVLRGDGTGQFGERLLLATTPDNATDETGLENNKGIAVGDLNGDGWLDIAVADASNPLGQIGNSVKFFLQNNDGSGQFQNPQAISNGIGTNPADVVVAQLNPLIDSLPDLAVACFASPRLVVYHGTSSGSFSLAQTDPLTYSPGNAAENLVTADWDCDGFEDLLVVDRQWLWLFRNHGEGYLEYVANISTAGFGQHEEYDLAVADLDGDGYPDYVVTNQLSSASATVAIGYGSGAMALPAPDLAINLSEAASGVAVADFNGDQIPDLAVGLPGIVENGRVAVLTGLGDREFAEPVYYDAGGHRTRAVVAGDFNADGRMDLAVANEGMVTQGHPGNVAVLLNQLPAEPNPSPTPTKTFYPTRTQTPTPTHTPSNTATPTATWTPGPMRPYDINEDGVVDSRDLQILLEQMGNQVVPE